jgi:hypothetical protein
MFCREGSAPSPIINRYVSPNNDAVKINTIIRNNMIIEVYNENLPDNLPATLGAITDASANISI